MNIKSFFFPCLKKLKEADKRTDAAIIDLRHAVNNDLKITQTKFVMTNIPKIKHNIKLVK